MKSSGGKKPGIWTQHQTKSGKVYYYNMAFGKSYWELPGTTEKEAEKVSEQDIAAFLEQQKNEISFSTA